MGEETKGKGSGRRGGGGGGRTSALIPFFPTRSLRQTYVNELKFRGSEYIANDLRNDRRKDISANVAIIYERDATLQVSGFLNFIYHQLIAAHINSTLNIRSVGNS